MPFDGFLLLFVHIDEQQIIAVELLGSLDERIELTLSGFVTADVVGDLYQLLYRPIFDDHKVDLPLSVTIVENILMLWTEAP